MASAEDREEEIEALKAIYGDDVKIVEPGQKFTVVIGPSPGGDDEDNPTKVSITLELGAEYPEAPPRVSTRALKGLTRQQLEPLAGLVTRKANQNLGGPMLFELCTYVCEWLQNDAQDPDGEELVAEAAAAAAAAFVPAGKKHGTPLTRENYVEWKARFDKEREEERKAREKGKPGQGPAEERLTGRQIFDISKGSVDWALFQDPAEDLDDEDLDSDGEAGAASGDGAAAAPPS
eukprot:TRINITY_DN18888_c2_g1_i1.p2 TRINITY_DN18888_c2_g1~~TRINITY_DN18888_c2_g1_i1.p2  ORF type:complete len:259 (+),score=113.67 TRINITY_DN18888_c2_g1_i1:76-777(+)